MTAVPTPRHQYHIKGTGMRSVPGSPPANFDLLVWLDPQGDLQEQAMNAACSMGYWDARVSVIIKRD